MAKKPAKVVPVTCPRCGNATPTALGQAASSMWWFTCRECKYVWSERSERDTGDSKKRAA